MLQVAINPGISVSDGGVLAQPASAVTMASNMSFDIRHRPQA
jgi:hypothetical protein